MQTERTHSKGRILLSVCHSVMQYWEEKGRWGIAPDNARWTTRQISNGFKWKYKCSWSGCKAYGRNGIDSF